jgi:hypothetical protein
MRREGDLLVEHLAGAKGDALLCAPFVKAGVLRRVLAAIPAGTRVSVITRWHAVEVASGVSDLDVFDVVSSRANTTLALIDALHAKIYVADGSVLTGSANLTAKALGWCADANLEVLTLAAQDCPSVADCMAAISTARAATIEERDRIAEDARGITTLRLPEAVEEEAELATTWYPRLGDPRRLFPIYAGRSLDRMMSATLEAGTHDLNALGIPPGLTESDFKLAAARAFTAMPSIGRLLSLVDRDLTDADAEELIAATPIPNGMAADQQWLVVREWIAHLLSDRIEVAPQSFVTRRRPGGPR